MKLPFRREKSEWVKVLEMLYDEKHVLPSDFEKEMPVSLIDMHNSIKSKSEITAQMTNVFLEPGFDYAEYHEQLVILQSLDLVDDEIIELGDKEFKHWGLTREGLQLAHQIKTEQQRRKTNFLLVVLTVVLVVLTVVLVGIELFEIPTYSI